MKSAYRSLIRTAGRPSDLKEGELRDAIIKAAMELIGDLGYEGTSVSQIAKKAGTTKPMVYYYFDSKINLVQKIIQEQIMRNQKVSDDILNQHNKTTIDRLFELVEMHKHELANNPQIVKFFHRISMAKIQTEESEFCPSKMVEAWYVKFLKLANEGLERSELKGDAEAIAANIHSIFNYNMMRHFIAETAGRGKYKMDSEKMLEHLLRGIARVIEPTERNSCREL